MKGTFRNLCEERREFKCVLHFIEVKYILFWVRFTFLLTLSPENRVYLNLPYLYSWIQRDGVGVGGDG